MEKKLQYQIRVIIFIIFGLFENYSEIVTFVEWPEIILNKPKNIIELYFSYENDFKERKLEIFSENRKEIINEFKQT